MYIVAEKNNVGQLEIHFTTFVQENNEPVDINICFYANVFDKFKIDITNHKQYDFCSFTIFAFKDGKCSILYSINQHLLIKKYSLVNNTNYPIKLVQTDINQ